MSARDVIRPEIRALQAYHVPSSSGMVKLDAMENPYALPEPLRAPLAAALANLQLNRYPAPHPEALEARLAAAMHVPEGSAVLLGNGSDEIIQMLALAVARPGAKLLALEPSFAMFRMIATFAGLEYVGVPLRPDFSLDEAALLEAVERHRPAITFIAYPNNPTGNLFDPAVIERVVAASPGIVVADEAYHAFARTSFMGHLPTADNLLVMRTLSKLGLAGIRLGLIAGSPELLAEVDKVRLPYNINVLTQVAAGVVLDRMFGTLGRLDGVEPFPSAANFILFRIGHAPEVFDGLKQRGILIKNLSASHPLLHGCLRVTVGTPEENDRFANALADCM